MTQRVLVFGASGRSGSQLLTLLRQKQPNWDIIGCYRNPNKINNDSNFRIVDLTNFPKHFIENDDIIINCAFLRNTHYFIDHLKNTNVFYCLGSMRIKSAIPDLKTDRVKFVYQLLQEKCPCSWVLFCPTMVYGAMGEDNINVLQKLIHYTPLIFMPHNSNQYVQPIHTFDMVQFMSDIIIKKWTNNSFLPLAGGEKLLYHDMIHKIAETMGKKTTIFTLPKIFTPLFIFMLKILGKDTNIIRRMVEDKSIDDKDYQLLLTLSAHKPMNLLQGLQFETHKEKP